MQEGGGAIKTIFYVDNESSIKDKKQEGLPPSCNFYLTKSNYKILLKLSVTLFCKTFLSLSLSSSGVTRFNALAGSALPNALPKLFRSSTIDKAA